MGFQAARRFLFPDQANLAWFLLTLITSESHDPTRWVLLVQLDMVRH
jgi:hypothetical protein